MYSNSYHRCTSCRGICRTRVSPSSGSFRPMFPRRRWRDDTGGKPLSPVPVRGAEDKGVVWWSHTDQHHHVVTSLQVAGVTSEYPDTAYWVYQYRQTISDMQVDNYTLHVV